MNKALARLSPMERRFVVGVAVVFVVVLNFWLVWPHFGDWTRTQTRLGAARKKLTDYNAEIRQTTNYEARIASLGGEGAAVAQEDQARDFALTIQRVADQCGVIIMANARPNTRTNQFFIEQIQSIPVQARENQLVSFLYLLGTDTSMIRARDLSIHPDPPRYALVGSISLVASYQRNPARPAPKSGKGAAPASKQITPPQKPSEPAAPPKSSPPPVVRPKQMTPPVTNTSPARAVAPSSTPTKKKSP